IVFAASGAVAREAWRYTRRRKVPLVQWIWDLPPWRLGPGRSDPVFDFRGRLFRIPRLTNGYTQRRRLYSNLHYIARSSAEVWVPSHATEADVRARFGVDSRRVAHCFDDRLFTPGDRTTAGEHLVTVSRLVPSKNQELVIRAAAILGMPVRIIGRGALENELRAVAKDLGVSCTVETGLSDQELLAAYRTAAVVVCPSRFEGFGLTGIEAASCATRVAASDIAPHREFLAGVAHFFPPDDPRAAATAIRAALEAPRPDPERVQWLSTSAAAKRFSEGFARLGVTARN
ncbi:MAG TPA: glycosyltransferase, partial [Gemmatimonadaceae bacterium]|nr:glycosyltransferase [Gemmatimonadaceae bacterium]